MTALVFVCVTCDERFADADAAREHEVRRHANLTASYVVVPADRERWYDDVVDIEVDRLARGSDDVERRAP